MFEELKHIITESSIEINPKGKDTYTERNISNFIFLSNNDNPVKLDNATARRFFVLRTAPP